MKTVIVGIVFGICVSTLTRAAQENSNVWVEDNQMIIQDKQGSPVPTTCELVAQDLDMHGVLAFVANSRKVKEEGPFHCQHAWNQELGTSSVWLRATIGESDFAIHVAKRAKSVPPIDGATGKVHLKEDKVNLNGKVKRMSKYSRLKNRFELLGAYNITDGVDMKQVPDEVLSEELQPIAAEPNVSLGYIQETEEELAAYDVKKYVPSVETLASVDSTYNFETENPNCAANEIVDQGSCGSCWAFAAGKAYSMSLYKQSGGRYNVNLAEQDLLSCMPQTGSFQLRSSNIGDEVVNPSLGSFSNGCTGGNAVGAWGPMKDDARVTRACDPYTGYAGIQTNRIVRDGVSADTCGSYASICRSNGQRDVEYKVDNIYMIDGSDENAVKAAIMEYGPVYVGVTWDSGLSEFDSGVYTSPQGNIDDGHAMVIVGWGTEGGQPYWMISNSHGINNNDRGHIKWGMQSSNPIGRVYAVKVKLPTQCQSQQPCQNGGAFEDDCQCRCVAPYSGTTCTDCGLTCQNGGTRVSGQCACSCPVGYFGDDCSNYILAYYTAVDANSATVRVEWDLQEFHQGNNVIERTVNPNGSGRCNNCPTLATINSQRGSTTQVLSWGSGFDGRPRGEQCHTARLSLGLNEFGASKGYVTNHIPCLKLGTGVSHRTQLTGASGACVCGGTPPPVDTVGVTLTCPTLSYTSNCCPEDASNCMGRTGPTDSSSAGSSSGGSSSGGSSSGGSSSSSGSGRVDRDAIQCPHWAQSYDCNGRYGSPIDGLLNEYCAASCAGLLIEEGPNTKNEDTWNEQTHKLTLI